jgi:hypothetical protein
MVSKRGNLYVFWKIYPNTDEVFPYTNIKEVFSVYKHYADTLN